MHQHRPLLWTAAISSFRFLQQHGGLFSVQVSPPAWGNSCEHATSRTAAPIMAHSCAASLKQLRWIRWKHHLTLIYIYIYIFLYLFMYCAPRKQRQILGSRIQILQLPNLSRQVTLILDSPTTFFRCSIPFPAQSPEPSRSSRTRTPLSPKSLNPYTPKPNTPKEALSPEP